VNLFKGKQSKSKEEEIEKKEETNKMTSEEFVVSLDPDTFEDPDEFVVSLDPATFEEPPKLILEDYSRNSIMPVSTPETKNTHLKACHPVVSRSLESIALAQSRTMTEIGQAAFYLGKDLLRTIPSINKVKRARKRILQATGIMDDAARLRYRRVLDQFVFDLGTDQVTSLQIRLYTSHLSEVNYVGSLLGKATVPKVRQLALMAGLIHSRWIGARDQREMVGLLKGFVRDLNRWASELAEIAEKVESIASGCIPLPLINNPWDEIVQPCKQGFIEYKE